MRNLPFIALAVILATFVCGTSTRGASTPISFGEVKTGVITSPDQTNFYSFTAVANQVIALALVRTTPTAAPLLYLYDPLGNLIIADGGNGAVVHEPSFRLTETGKYIVAVVASDFVGSYSYSLTVTQVGGINLREVGDDPEPVNYGQVAKGHITGAADMDTYTFIANANDVIALALVRTTPTAAPILYVFDPLGNMIIASGGDGAVVHYPDLRLTESGKYTCIVIAGGLADSYGYVLSLAKAVGPGNTREPGDDPEFINFGQALKGHIGGPADMDTYSFIANANDVIALALVRTTPTAAPILYVFDPLGNTIIASGGDGAAVHYPELRLAQTGRYTCLVIAGGLLDTYGYVMSLARVSGGGNVREVGDSPELLTFGLVSSGHITGPADMDTYTFSAKADDVIALALTRTTPTAGPILYLFDPLGNMVFGSGGDGAVVYYPEQRLSEGGRYTCVVVAGGLQNNYDYTLCAVKIPGSNSPDLGDGVEVVSAGEIRKARVAQGDLDAFRLELVAGDAMTVDVSSTSGSGTPFIQLYAPDGTTLDSAEGAHARISVPCAAQTGGYYLLCRDSGLTQTFSYNVTLNQYPTRPASFDPDHPALAIFRCAPHIVVRWPEIATGFALEYATEADHGSWSAIPGPYPLFMNYYYVTNQSLDPARVYRLHKP
ncbi:MAG: hypothetical protein HYR88_08750 [Verrucomicrobia bacterium]|nr:hypothetical protein [Verrucomicrobiota bacterium]